jgi:ABC-type lipoprotein export system ATPase subunit
MIELRDVSKTYIVRGQPPLNAVRNINLRVANGEFVVITGRSGSGKTTILNLTAGLTRPTTGQVLLDGDDIWQLSDKEQSLRRNHAIGCIFQFPSLLPSLTTLENVVLPTTFAARNDLGDAYERARGLMRTVGLADKLGAFPRQLSAGQQQRVVIARALMNHPGILLADEATSNLDEQTEQEIMLLLKEIHEQMNVTILMVSHTTQLVRYGTRAIELAQGTVTRDVRRTVIPASPALAAVAVA